MTSCPRIPDSVRAARMSVTFENLTLCTCQTNPRLELAARCDMLDRSWKTSRGLRQVERTWGQNATPSATAGLGQGRISKLSKWRVKMPHCTKYGAAVAEASRFVPRCAQTWRGRVMFSMSDQHIASRC